PLCTGCDTDLRAITPGATFSTGELSLALTGPLPSIGLPSASTTRPSSSGPTGTSRMRPVVLTVSPSVRYSYSPSTTAPTESRSRFSASAVPLFGSSIISPDITSARPWMRTMPSDTETMVPSLRASAASFTFSMRLRISSLISEGLSVVAMLVSLITRRCAAHGELNLLVQQRRLQAFQPPAHRAVDDHIAGVDHGAADHGRIDALLQFDLACE